MSEGLRRKLPGLAFAAILLGHLVFGSVYVTAERPNQDEGWYLSAARQVRAGERPYLDFAYVQPPLLPYVYGLLGADRSVSAGRSVTLLFSLLAVLFVGLAAWRNGALAGLTAALLLGLTPFVLSQHSIVKTYALANCLVAGGLLLAVRAGPRAAMVAGAAACFALAALVRNSVATALLGYWLWLLVEPGRRRQFGAALLAGLAPVVIGMLPFLVADAGAVRYNLFEHHAANVGTANLSVVIVAVALLVIRACAPLAGLTAAGLGYLVAERREAVETWPEIRLCGLLGLLIAGGHFVSSHPYQEYQVLAVPPFCVLAGLCWGEVARTGGARALCRAVVIAVAGLVPLLALPPATTELPGNRPGADGRIDPAGVHGPLRRVAALVQAHSRPTEPIFTFQTEVAIEAHRPLLPGLGLASFSFTDDPNAAAHHLVNPEIIRGYFADARAAVVALSPGDLGNLLHGAWEEDRIVIQPGLDPAAAAIYGPLVAALDRNYRLVGRVEGVGQFAETYSVLARRSR